MIGSAEEALVFGINAPRQHISNTNSSSTAMDGGDQVNGDGDEEQNGEMSIALLVCIVGDQASKEVYEFFITQTFR